MKETHLIFPGQGSQFVGMGHDFFNQFETAKQRFNQANELLGYSISDICFTGPEETLNQTQYTQVAIFITSACIYDQIATLDLNISSYAGHSLGEITAYYAAGVIDFETALTIVIKRGELMGAAAKQTNGSMAAIIGMDETSISNTIAPIEHVEIANYNSPVQFVISGESSAVKSACTALSENGAKRVIPLPVSGAFHSPLMKSAVEPFKEFLNTKTFNDAGKPIILNRIASKETNPSNLQENLSLQIESSVQWIQSINTMAKECTQFIEVGPGKVLSGLVKKINRDYNVQPTSSIESLSQIQSLVEA